MRQEKHHRPEDNGKNDAKLQADVDDFADRLHVLSSPAPGAEHYDSFPDAHNYHLEEKLNLVDQRHPRKG